MDVNAMVSIHAYAMHSLLEDRHTNGTESAHE